MKTGIAFIPKNTSLPGIINQGGLMSYLKDLAKELDRPYVQAYDTFSQTRNGPVMTVYLKIPKSERFNKLISGLLILAILKRDKDEWHGSMADITVFRGKALTEFKFRGEGVKVFMHWMDQCKNDPIFRVLLRHD